MSSSRGMDEALRLATGMAVMNNGRLIRLAPRPHSPGAGGQFRARFLGGEPCGYGFSTSCRSAS
jgi:hypothetical protein